MKGPEPPLLYSPLLAPKLSPWDFEVLPQLKVKLGKTAGKSRTELETDFLKS